MEEIISRFSHLSENVFSKLDDENIAKCKKVARPWSSYLEEQKFFQIRKIRSIIKKFHDVGDAWRIAFKPSSKINIKVLVLL